MSTVKKADVSVELARIMPAMLREMTKRHDEFIARPNLAVSHIVVLDLLKEHGPSTMGEIAQILDLTMGAATGIVDRMVKTGLVERKHSEKDRRVVNVALKKKGQETIERLEGTRKKMIGEMLSILTDEETSEYLRIIRKLYDNIRNKK